MMHKFTLLLVMLMAYFVLNVPSAQATEGTKAKAFIEGLGKEAVGFLRDDNISQAQKQDKFRVLLKEKFDMATIGRFALGKNWRSATKSQQQEYLSLFEDMVVRVYSSRFKEYKGQGFEVNGFRDTGKKDVLVTSYIIPDSGSKVQVDWRVRDKNGSMKIIDVIIEGVSMSLTQRSDFSSVIQRGGGNVDVLIQHLKK